MTNGFYVQPPAVRAFGRRVDRCKQDAGDGLGYLRRQGSFSVPVDSGLIGQVPLINALKAAHDDVVAELTGRIERLHEVLRESAVALDRAAGYYEQTDVEKARDFDRGLPPVSRPTRPH